MSWKDITLAQDSAADCQMAMDISASAFEYFEGYATKTGRSINNYFYGTGKGQLKNPNGKPWDFQDSFFIQLMMVAATVGSGEIHASTLNFLKNNFYKWVYQSGMTVDNCPQDFGHFLIALNEALNGDTEKLTIDKNASRPVNVRNNAQNDMSVFRNYQQGLHNTTLIRNSLGNKSIDEATIKQIDIDLGEGKSDEEICKEGKQIFEKIEKKYYPEYKNYDLYIPYEQRINVNKNHNINYGQGLI